MTKRGNNSHHYYILYRNLFLVEFLGLLQVKEEKE